MNKIKVMLTAIFIIGTVGGVLAIKAKRSDRFCTTAAAVDVAHCAACKNGINVQKGGSVKFCYVETLNTARCSVDNPACTTVDELAND